MNDDGGFMKLRSLLIRCDSRAQRIQTSQPEAFEASPSAEFAFARLDQS